MKIEYHLTMDRINGNGVENINILMVTMTYKGIAIPIYWVLLDKKGNSNTRERIALINHVIRQFAKQQIISLLTDREFIGNAITKNKYPGNRIRIRIMVKNGKILILPSVSKM